MMKIAETLKDLSPVAFAVAAIIALAIAFGGPSTPATHAELRAAFDRIDFDDLPAVATFAARDGTSLAYRAYGDAGPPIALLHGSGGAGAALHRLADELAKSGRRVFAPDIRGHGASGEPGDVAYIGQVEDDIDDLIAHMRSLGVGGPVDLVGFSMGGGLALRYAAKRGGDIGRAVLISPYLAHDAPPSRSAAADDNAIVWAKAGVPRIIALTALNGIGVTAFNGLEAIRLAVDPRDEGLVTAAYSYRLMKSVNSADWRRDLTAVAPNLTLIASDEDELHALAGYREALAAHAPAARLIELSGASHIELILADDAIAAIVDEMGR